jgi:pSer/pThr/pTyr-binding forkhead associated (FHA) protein
MGQLLMKMLVGVIVGVAVWMLFEPFAPPVGNPREAAWELGLVTCFGAVLGLAIGALNGWIRGSKVHMLSGAGFGLVFGLIGAPLGYQIGGGLINAIWHNQAIFISNDYMLTTKIFARIVALTPIGLLLGGAIGASSLNGRRAIQGVVGGAIGAFVGGLIFDPLGTIIGPASVALKGAQGGAVVETGSVSRAMFFVIVGGLIALFIGLVDLLARSAWVRLVLGRNEGKEWPIDAEKTFIGRNERAGIPLFGDPNIAPMHACIMKQGNAYSIVDGGSPMGTFVNGQRIGQAPLFHGAQIQVGGYTLQFLMKHGAAPVRGPEQFNQAYAIQNQPQGQPVGATPYAAAAQGYPQQTQAMPAPAGGPAPGSLYGSAPTQAMPAPSGSFAAQQPTVAFQNPASQPTQAYAPSAGFSLAAVDGPLIGQRYPVRATIELGRESASVPMSFDSGASRRHASVAPGPMGVMVTDLNSTNGTFVNGQRVQTANAGPGDLIRVGATTFRVEPG